MLWLAIHFPDLPLEVYQRASSQDAPLAISDGNLILACNAQARAAGVYPGQSRLAALAVNAAVRIRPRQAALERAALEQLGAWALGFSDQVSLEPPWSLVLEAERSLRLFGGAQALSRRVIESAVACGYQSRVCMAPTPGGALLLAAWGCGEILLDKCALRRQLTQLPIAALGFKKRLTTDCQRLGLRSIGELLALPRDGLALRLGIGQLNRLDRLLGDQPDPRAWFVPPACYHGELELPAEVRDAPALVFAARRLLDELASLLYAQRAAVAALHWTWRHAADKYTRLRVGSARLEADPERWLLLLRERLASQPLSAPVRAIELDTGALIPRQVIATDLFGAPNGGDARATDLIDRLCARLGDEAVYCLALVADHRPELAWCRAPPMVTTGAHRGGHSGGHSGKRADSPEAGADVPVEPRADRPLWLLPQPLGLRLQAGRLWLGERTGGSAWPGLSRTQPWSFFGGRERIETGWWDECSVARDYFTVRAPDGEAFWVYRNLTGSRGWYLQGVFGHSDAPVALASCQPPRGTHPGSRSTAVFRLNGLADSKPSAAQV